MSRPRRRVEPGWGVLIVEDNVDVAEVHRRLVDLTPGFCTELVVSNGDAAYDAVRSLSIDLVILDLSLPGENGLSFLRRVRENSVPLEVIVVTAARDASTARQSMHLGALDYLVKPFAPERLRQSLTVFSRRTRMLQKQRLCQADLDVAQAHSATLRRLPKGLKSSTLDGVTTVLRRTATALTADEVGTAIGTSRVTARRYLEYLEVTGLARMERDHSTSGRPRHRYHWHEQGG